MEGQFCELSKASSFKGLRGEGTSGKAEEFEIEIPSFIPLIYQKFLENVSTAKESLNGVKDLETF